MASPRLLTPSSSSSIATEAKIPALQFLPSSISHSPSSSSQTHTLPNSHYLFMDHLLPDIYSAAVKSDAVGLDVGDNNRSDEPVGPLTKQEVTTLEDYLVRTNVAAASAVVDNCSSVVEFSSTTAGNGRGRGRKKTVAIDEADRAALQRQKRMIKNRESASRSRERKQARTIELENLEIQLKKENEMLLREQEALRCQRLEQLMKNVIPATKAMRSKQSQRLRRTHSWPILYDVEVDKF